MTRIARAVLFALVVMPPSAMAAIEAEHPSDFVRVLESESRDLWAEAVVGLLGEDDELPDLAVSSVLRRLHDVDIDLQARVIRALSNNLWHPRTLTTLRTYVASSDGDLRDAALATILKIRSPGAMDVFRDLIERESPYRIDALRSLVETFDHWLEFLEAPQDFGRELDPVLDRANGTPREIFDRRYLPAVTALLHSPNPEIRSEALSITGSLDTPGLRDAWAQLMDDPDPGIQSSARWQLAEMGDPRPCPALFQHAEEVARTWTDKRARNHRIRVIGSECARTYYFEYFRWYKSASDESRRSLYKELIYGATGRHLADDPSILERLRPLAEDSDDLVREAARQVLAWHDEARAKQRAADIRGGVKPLVLVGLAFVSAVVGVLLFAWAFRLYALSQRVRNRPVAKIRSMAIGPVSLEGEVQPAEDYLVHPVTGEPCVYYIGADSDHPDARFYIVDDTGRVLVDPQRAVIFSDDGVLVAGEKIHLVGFAESLADGELHVTKDPALPPLYQRVTHAAIEVLLGFGRKSGVTKMLFSDPSRCFWIWDDLDRKPLGEKRDFLWLGAAVALGGAWMVLFAVAVLALIDQEMSAALAKSLASVTGPEASLIQILGQTTR